MREADAGPDARQEEATQSLSQLAARILDQLSVSAWLPSAALVLGAAFLLQLGSALDAATKAESVRTAAAQQTSRSSDGPSQTQPINVRPSSQPGGFIPSIAPSASVASAATSATVEPPLPAPEETGQIVNRTLSSLAHIGFGGALMLVIVIVVTTMLTQSFAFEAIRVLEGYWGPFLPLEWLTDLGSSRFRWSARYLIWRRGRLLGAAVAQVEQKLRRKEKERLASGGSAFFTDARLGHLSRSILEEDAQGNPDEAMRNWVKRYRWRRDLDSSTSRRLTNVETRLRDYPEPGRALPTRLGNVIRHYEDNTGERNLESFVQRVWHMLPFSLQIQHDEYRARLDLYCTMVFVFPTLALLAVTRLHTYPTYLVGILLVIAFSCWWTYRAAVASARAWGQTLELIAAHVQRERARLEHARKEAKLSLDSSSTYRGWQLRMRPNWLGRRGHPD